MTSPIPLKPKPIEINGFSGVITGTTDGRVAWKITKTITVEFFGTNADEQEATREMRSFIDAYERHRTRVADDVAGE